MGARSLLGMAYAGIATVEDASQELERAQREAAALEEQLYGPDLAADRVAPRARAWAASASVAAARSRLWVSAAQWAQALVCGEHPGG